MSQKQLTCILFDLDCTLIDTTPLIFQCYRYALQRVLGYVPPDEHFLPGFGRPLGEAMRLVLSELTKVQKEEGTASPSDVENCSAPTSLTAEERLNAELLDELIDAYTEFNLSHHDMLIRQFEGVREVLTELARRDYTLGVVTSKRRSLAERGLARCGLSGLLPLLVCLEDTTAHKPHPAPIQKAMAMLGVGPDHTLYVGDSIHDVMAGKAADVRTAAALWGPFPKESLESLAPDYLLESIYDLLTICPPLATAPSLRKVTAPPETWED
ncbi:MAG: HAD-IA family hydrolase [Chloroflexi bacterium]|nr:HAD-IA family hydrolase [Chloroflexota bacterium]MCL5076359.1 HAD-IA family hydrolase [Chloroflexota bacterium]